MRLLWMVVVAMMATLGLNAADLAGTWKGSMDTQMGNTAVTITLQPGSALAGTVKIGDYNAAIEKGKLDGSALSFEINIEHGKMVFEGTASGGEMKLNVIGTQGDKYALNCKRQQ